MVLAPVLLLGREIVETLDVARRNNVWSIRTAAVWERSTWDTAIE